QPTATLIGFHGHTLWHAPEIGQTRQAGNGALLAALTGIDTVNDMRSADMHAGGQGAPLAPLYHAALAKGLPGPIAVLNLGGVGNLTFIDGEQVLAFDTGPGNAPLDDWVKSKAGLPFDEGGALAASGRVDEGLVASWRANPYFDQPPPKSLDRNAFQFDGLDRLNLEDGAATLAAFTTATVVDSRHHVPVKPIRWLVTGGGRHNAFLMAQLANQLGSPVEPVESVGWNGDLLEAEAFAFLAVRSRRGLPLTRPTTTGVSQPTVGGIFHPTEKSSKRS
ncbi:MAG: anhydro-N-acetylmuramic acid kinase, partial [Pseudomonadota bacterium]